MCVKTSDASKGPVLPPQTGRERRTGEADGDLPVAVIGPEEVVPTEAGADIIKTQHGTWGLLGRAGVEVSKSEGGKRGGFVSNAIGC